MARRPPNSGTVMASSTRRDGSAASSSPSSRTSENGSLGSSTADAIKRVGALAHQAGIGTVEQDDRPARDRAGRESVDRLFRAARPRVRDAASHWMRAGVPKRYVPA